VFDLKYHVVWIAKCRYKGLKGYVAERARDLIRPICEAHEVVTYGGTVSPDHIHMLLSPPTFFCQLQLLRPLAKSSPPTLTKS